MPLWKSWMEDPGDEGPDPAEPPPPGAPIPREPDYSMLVWMGQARNRRRREVLAEAKRHSDKLWQQILDSLRRAA